MSKMGQVELIQKMQQANHSMFTVSNAVLFTIPFFPLANLPHPVLN